MTSEPMTHKQAILALALFGAAAETARRVFVWWFWRGTPR